MLKDLKQAGAKLAILTNGDPDMIADAVAFSGLGGELDEIITVHEAGVYKPSPAVYRLACDRFGVAPGAISFQSSNRWDIAGAKAFGLHAVWINRQGAPDEYPDMPADRVYGDLKPLLLMTSRS